MFVNEVFFAFILLSVITVLFFSLYKFNKNNNKFQYTLHKLQLVHMYLVFVDNFHQFISRAKQFYFVYKCFYDAVNNLCQACY